MRIASKAEIRPMVKDRSAGTILGRKASVHNVDNPRSADGASVNTIVALCNKLMIATVSR